MKPVCYLSLAKQAKADGKPELIKHYLNNQARIMRKKMTPVQRSQG